MNKVLIAQKTLAKVNPALLTEFSDLLREGDMSDAARILTKKQRARILERLSTARIKSRCACGQPECHTYNFVVPEKTASVKPYTVRFYVRGEALMDVDDDGDIYTVERLYDFKPGPRYTNVLQPDGSWPLVHVDTTSRSLTQHDASEVSDDDRSDRAGRHLGERVQERFYACYEYDD
ncbi:MAG: hypothetical protein ABSE64_16025 [Vulcanimicrobiaceae bacterium]